jgi:pilus assembly protein Flp/PilA
MPDRHAIGARQAPSPVSTRDARHERAGETLMNNIINRLRTIVREESGQDLIEYAMLVALIALGCVIAVTSAGTMVKEVFEGIVAQIPS